MKIKRLKKQKHGYLIHTWSDKDLKGAVVNREVSCLNGGSLEITLRGPLSRFLTLKPSWNLFWLTFEAISTDPLFADLCSRNKEENWRNLTRFEIETAMHLSHYHSDKGLQGRVVIHEYATL